MLSETKIEEIKEVIKKNQTAKAHLLWQELRLDTDETAKTWVAPLKIVALPLLVDAEVSDLFKQDISAVSQAYHIPVAERMKRRLNMVSDEQSDEFIEHLFSEGNPHNKAVIEAALEYDLSKVQSESTDEHALQDMSLVDDIQKVQFHPQVNEQAQSVALHKILLSEQRGDSFTHHFDPQDAKEIDWHRKMVPESAVILDYRKIAEALMHKYSLQFEEDLRIQRFGSVLAAQIKGLRTKKQTLALLVRGHKIGGLEIPEETAQQIVQEIEDHYPAAQSIPQEPFPTPSVLAQSLSSEHKDTAPTAPSQSARDSVVPSVTASHDASQQQALQSATNRPDVVSIALDAFTPSAVSGIDGQQQGVSVQTGNSGNKIPVRKIVDTQKPNMQDIAPVRPMGQQVMGTVEQLGTISLDDVRMSPHGIRDIFARVQHEITTMAQQSYDKRLAAVRQWRQSPLYKQYVSIGNRAMQGAKSVSQIISEDGSNGLTQEEFDAIADFNTELE
ncbi:MAG: hypothetical protein A3H59_01995 [Candidatus Jacksonbacteria bacterium RIFCSPLOWO2_02_FULL_43_9]|nr:MAG: hypothetical protein UV70_C0004G0044 [Parcubacteria group bacterium GW2011_GWA2_43_13]OGY70152.1 MAG: hypothetical protein A2986_03555 [Candidatus Jacksonbacteria bacterium RIFCSPLOWO2_01_FULL_44_13]OGY73233.1 MAG: hypothetical protein A3H59_01995 [Candidatus Jacksonbacteria bacterium RIFCSPLOWO2_02_FULL_43_9]HAZ16478.1 hypothetical protein [Candidatus Jacksonbacteria bacterium]